MYGEHSEKAHPKQAGKGLLKWVLYLLVMTGIFAILTVVIQGWPLFFTHPEIEDIQCVTATNSSTGETVQVDASTGDMEFEFTSNLLGCLSYKPFSRGGGGACLHAGIFPKGRKPVYHRDQ